MGAFWFERCQTREKSKIIAQQINIESKVKMKTFAELMDFTNYTCEIKSNTIL